jgi:HK97 family phage major capsid protein/HK97 family phage prohead protease
MKGTTKTTALLVAGSLGATALIGQAFTRSVTAEQINDNNGHGPLRRTAEVRTIDEDARTIEVAFSSETPVARWFGDEVLDHSTGSMIADRLDNGAAVLWNHDHDTQIGVVESARIDGDRVGRAVLRFGRSARAEEIWQDVVGGVIRHISVGYFVKAVKTEEREGETDKVTITEWEPYEISLVSIPADPSVGVGRSVGEPPEEPQNERGNTDTQIDDTETEGSGNMKTKIIRNAAGDLVRVKVDEAGNIGEVVEVLERASETKAMVTRGQEQEQTRVAALMEIGEQYSAQSLVNEAVRSGATVEDFTRSVLDHVHGGNENNSRSNQPLADDGGQIGLTVAEADRFSFARALRALATPNDRALQEEAAFEYDASRAAAQALGRDAQGIMVPMDVLHRALNINTDGASPGNTGGLAIGTTLMSQSFIEMLRNRSVFLALATPLGGLQGNYDLIGQAGGASGYWLDDDEDAGEGNQDLRDINMSPKTVGAYSEITRSALRQTSIDTEAMVRRDLAAALGLTIDKAGHYGDGVKKPLGLKNQAGVNAVTFAGAYPTYGELVQMESEISSDNADVENMAYCANARFRGHCKTTEKFAGSNGAPIWETGNQVNGYRAEITNQVDQGDVFHGNYADAVVGAWGGLDLTVDPYTHSRKGRLRIVAFQDVDVVFRRVESFCYGAPA